MTHVNVPNDFQSGPQVSIGGRVSGFQQLVGHFGKRADDDNSLCALPAFDNLDQTPYPFVFHRRPPKLHDHDIVALFESALPLPAHWCLLLEFLRQNKNPPPDRFWRWVRWTRLRLLYFIRSRLPEDTQ